MRIAYIGNPATVHIQRWLREFASRGHECRLFAPDQMDVGRRDS